MSQRGGTVLAVSAKWFFHLYCDYFMSTEVHYDQFKLFSEMYKCMERGDNHVQQSRFNSFQQWEGIDWRHTLAVKARVQGWGRCQFSNNSALWLMITNCKQIKINHSDLVHIPPWPVHDLVMTVTICWLYK